MTYAKDNLDPIGREYDRLLEQQPPSWAPGIATTTFPARLSASLGNGAYTGKEQTLTGEGTFVDKPGASNITILNVAETGYATSAINVTGNPVVLVVPHQSYYLCDRPTNVQYKA